MLLYNYYKARVSFKKLDEKFCSFYFISNQKKKTCWTIVMNLKAK